MIDELALCGRTCPVAVADVGYTHFRAGLIHRSTPWVMAVKAGNTVYTADAVPDRLATGGERGRPSGPRYGGGPSAGATRAVMPRMSPSLD